MSFKNPVGAPRKPKEDLTGLVFGRLTVKNYIHVEVRPTGRWVCECVCGKEVIVATAMLKNGHTKGCNSCPRIKNIVGEKFGRLVVIEFATQKIHPSGQTESTWLCDCLCGSKTIVSLSNLRSGGVKSCGCLLVNMGPKAVGKSSNSTSISKSLGSAIRTSPANFKWKAACLSRDMKTCQLCGVKNPQICRIIVHHIVRLVDIVKRNGITNLEEALNCPLLWDESNGVSLCSSCHTLVHSPSLVTIC